MTGGIGQSSPFAPESLERRRLSRSHILILRGPTSGSSCADEADHRRLVATLCRQHRVTIIASASNAASPTDDETPEGARILHVEDHPVEGFERPIQTAGSADLVEFALGGRFDTLFHHAVLRHLPTVDLIVHETPLTALYDITMAFDGKPRVYLGQAYEESADDAGRFVSALYRHVTCHGRRVSERHGDRAGPDVAAESILDGLAEIRDGTGRSRHLLHLNDFDPRVRSGGGTRIRALLQQSGRRLPTILLCLSDSRRVDVGTLPENVTFVAVPKTDRHRDRARRAERFGFPVADIVAYEEAPRNEMLKLLYAYLRQGAEETILEHCYMAGLPAAFDDRIVYSSYNDELELKRQLLAEHPDRGRLLALVDEAEGRCLQAANRVIATTEADLDAFRTRLGDNRPAMQVIPNSAEEPAKSSPDDERTATGMGPRSVVFVGSAHPPNIEAARFIVETLAPSLPNAEFHLIGSVGNNLPTSRPNVVIWGEVSASLKSALLRRAVLAVNPVRSGGGSNVKLADYIAHGLPVVSFPFGVRGYDNGSNLRISIAVNSSQFFSITKQIISKI